MPATKKKHTTVSQKAIIPLFKKTSIPKITTLFLYIVVKADQKIRVIQINGTMCCRLFLTL